MSENLISTAEQLFGKENIILIIDKKYTIKGYNLSAKKHIKKFFRKEVDKGHKIQEIIDYFSFREFYSYVEQAFSTKKPVFFVFDNENKTFFNGLYYLKGKIVIVIPPTYNIIDSKSYFYRTIPEILFKVEIKKDGKKDIRVLSGSFSKHLGVNTRKYFEDIVSGKLEKYIPEDDIKRLIETAKKLKKRKTVKLLYRFKNPRTKKILWLEEKVVRNYNNKNQHVANIGITRVVTNEINYLQKLKESERKFRFLFENNLSGLFISNLSTGKIIDCNTSFAKILGYTKKEILQKNALDLYFRKEDRENYLKDLHKKGYLESYKIKLKSKSGKPVWVMENVKITENKETGESFIHGSLIDITENVNFEGRIIQKEKELSYLLETSPMGVILVREDKIIYCNHAFAKITEKGYRNIIGKDISIFFPEEEYKKIKKWVYSEKKGKESIETILLKKRRKYIEVEMFVRFVEYEGKVAIMFTFHNLAEKREMERIKIRSEITMEINKKLREEIKHRKLIEEQLRVTQKYNKSIIDSSLDMIIACDNKGRIIEYNVAAKKTFGYEWEEAVGKSVELLYANETERNIVWEGLYKNGHYVGEVENRRKNGETFISFLSASVLRDEKNRIIGTMGISRDISLLKQTEKILKQNEQTIRAIINSIPETILRIEKSTLNVVELFNTNKLGIPGFFMSDQVHTQHNIKEIISIPSVTDKIVSGIFSVAETSPQKITFIWKGTEYVISYLFSELNEKEMLLVLKNITEEEQSSRTIKKALTEKEILLKEIHHRVKNNLQVISSLLNLQQTFLEDEKALKVIKESQTRIRSMAFLHENLYRNKDFSNIDFQVYLCNLVNNLSMTYFDETKDIKVILNNKIEKMHIDQALPCGLIINELISNAFKYAFPHTKKGEIQVNAYVVEDQIYIAVSDNGVGFKKDFNIKQTPTLGWQLIHSLCEQLDAEMWLNSENGVKFVFNFKKISTNVKN